MAAPAELEITDEKIFERLREAGLNLSEEAIVGGFLYFPAENPARRAATELESAGFAAFADPSPPTRWVVETEVRTIPTPEYIQEMGGKLRTVARANGGMYDGWWAVEPPEEGEEGAQSAAMPQEVIDEVTTQAPTEETPKDEVALRPIPEPGEAPSADPAE